MQVQQRVWCLDVKRGSQHVAAHVMPCQILQLAACICSSGVTARSLTLKRYCAWAAAHPSMLRSAGSRISTAAVQIL